MGGEVVRQMGGGALTQPDRYSQALLTGDGILDKCFSRDNILEVVCTRGLVLGHRGKALHGMVELV